MTRIVTRQHDHETLLEIRRQMNEAAEQDDRIQELRERLDAALELRAAAVAAATDLLELYATRDSGIDFRAANSLRRGLADAAASLGRPKKKKKATKKKATKKKATKKKATKKKATKKKATKKKATKKKATKKIAGAKKKTKQKVVKSKTADNVRRSSETGRKMPSRSKKAVGYPHKLADAIAMTPKEKDFVDVMIERWPLFTTPEFFVRKGLSSATNAVTAHMSHLRKKGVPIESARDARKTDASVSDGDRGYRLVG